MTNSNCLKLFLLLLVSLQVSEAAEHTTIFVTTSQGVLDSSCWTGGVTKPCGSLDLALEGVHNLSASSQSVWVFLLPGSHSLDTVKHSRFVGPEIQDFGLVANNSLSESLPLVNCGKDVGFSFMSVSRITIENIVFKGCSSVQPTTSSRISNTTAEYWEFRVGLYFVLCSDILFDNVWVNHTNGIGAFLYSPYGDNMFQRCGFHNNSAINNIQYPAGGGLYIEYSSCIPVNTTTCTQRTHYQPSSLVIENTIFDRNLATVPDRILVRDYWLLPTGARHSSIGRGGGLSITFEGESNNINVIISNTNFTHNEAFWGGGLFVEFHDNASRNVLTLNNAQFLNNSVTMDREHGTGGGGMRLAILFSKPSCVHNNSLTFSDCVFDSNRAKWGGGVSFYVAREHEVLVPSNSLYFARCTWCNNSAWLGAAVDLSIWQANSVGLPPLVRFANMFVHNNSVLQANWTLLGVGVFYIDGVPTEFKGYNNFEFNTGSAIAVMGTFINMTKNVFVFFLSNDGRKGGALQLVGNSFITVSEGAQLGFFGNTATQKGGAIYVETVSKHDFITGPNCFVRYEDITLPPKNWGSFFSFAKNKVNGRDNSIYLTTTVSCEWHDSQNTTNSGSNGTALCWNKWSYYNDSGQDKCSRQIQTDPQEFDTTNFSYIERILAIPGQKITLSKQYNVVDDFSNSATKRLVLTTNIKEPIIHNTPNSSEIIEPNASIPTFITDNSFTIQGQTNKTYIVELYTMDPRVVYTTAQVELLPCPFGFINDNEQGCQCSTKEASFNGIIQCSRINFTSSLNLLGQWAGINKRTGNRVAGNSPFTEILNVSQLTLPLPTQVRDPGDYFCNHVNRFDVLCGRCVNGTGPSINSQIYTCVECPPGIEKYSWLLYIATEILPLTIFFLLIILFNVSLTSGTANAFIFFSQVITTTFGIYTASSGPYHSLREAYKIVYGVWNLDILSSLTFFQYCLAPELGTLTLIALEYIIALYPLLVIAVLYTITAMYNCGFRPVIWLCKPIRHCFIRLRNVWNPKDSLIDAIAAFILLSYSRMVQTSLKLMQYASLFLENGTVESHVAYYDGTMQAYQGEHLVFVGIAAIVLLVFIIPPTLVLILYPLKIFRRFTDKFCSLADGKFELFLNAFYGSFKDGTQEGSRDYRSFAGLYLFYRFLFAVLRFTGSWQLQYLIQNINCILALIAFTTLRPYRNDMHNKFDACIFALLLLISLFNQFNFNLVYLESDHNVSPLMFAIEYLLIWIPFIAVTCLLVYWIGNRYGKKIKKRVNRSHKLEATLSHADIMPTASGIHDDNSIMQLVDERPLMYNYGSVRFAPINNSDTTSSKGNTDPREEPKIAASTNVGALINNGNVPLLSHELNTV